MHARNAVTWTSLAVTTTSNPLRETNADDLPLYTYIQYAKPILNHFLLLVVRRSWFDAWK